MKGKAKPIIRVRVNVQPGPASLPHKTAWRKFFTRLAAECHRELKAESEAKREQ